MALLLLALSLFSFAVANPIFSDPPYNASIRPLVLWHGLGDSYASVGMLEFAELCRETHPGMFVHSIIVEEGLDKDQRAGFFGNVEEQLEGVSEQLKAVPELKGGFDALGFSQGGQFLRAYVEKYNQPPVNNLMTFGSQHMGVSDLPTCRPGDFLCLVARAAAKRGVYSSYAQNNLIQAQYFRDPSRLPLYLSTNTFLSGINGEIEESRNHTYRRNLEELGGTFVMVLFSRDKTVVPKESSWFGSYAPTEEEDWSVQEVLPMRRQPLYTEDWIGLRKLDEAGKVKLLSCDGEHMQISHECWVPIVTTYAGGVVRVASVKEGWRASLPALVIQS